MKTVNKLRWSGASLGLCLVSVLFSSRPAVAEVKLVETDGWTFSFGGRVNAFASGGKGDDFPIPTLGQPHTVMGGSGNAHGAKGIPDVGWTSAYQQDASDKYAAIRVRSGMLPNVLGFGLTKQVSEGLVLKAYVEMWSTIETAGRDNFAPIDVEARVGYFTATGSWGTATVGRMLNWIGRTSYETDLAYGHGYGVGLPCTDALGPACGHVGTGALFPGYSAGMSYSSPEFQGIQLNIGAYDPVTFSGDAVNWSRAPYPRGEGSLTLTRGFGEMGHFKIGVEGAYQPIRRIGSATDANGMTTAINVDSAIWGVSGGARLEVGPARLGVSGFRGRGLGIGNAFQRTDATADDFAPGPNGSTYGLRTSTGVYGQVGAFLGSKLQIAAGFGMSIVDQLAADKANPNLSVIHTQTGISGAVYYHLSDSLVMGVDFFNFRASWYGAPIVDMNNQPTGTKLAGELQTLNFLNAGVTYHW